MAARKNTKTKKNPDLKKRLVKIVDKYKGKKGSLIPILQKAQEEFGYLPPEVIRKISVQTGLPLSQVYGVVTFYAQFHLEPRGKHTVKACRGTACHVRGGANVLDELKDTLGVDEGETTQDYNFTLETVACLGACALAPVVVVDGDYIGKVDTEKIQAILDQYSE